MGRFAIRILEDARKVASKLPTFTKNWFPTTSAPDKICRTFSTSNTKRVLHCDLTKAPIPNMTFPDMCWARVEEFRERVALVDFPSGNQITFGQARDLARWLVGLQDWALSQGRL